MLGGGITSANARPAGCPPAFQGPLTFEEINIAWPPPPDFDIEAHLAAIDVNDDQLLCVRELPTHQGGTFGPINLIDNAART